MLHVSTQVNCLKNGLLLSQLATYIAKALSLTGSQHVIDLGCGEADLTNAMAPCAEMVTGVDQNGEALAEAEEAANVTLVKGCMTKLPDLVTRPAHHAMLYNTLQYLSSEDAVFSILRAVYATLQPSGYFYIGGILHQDMMAEFGHQWSLVAGQSAPHLHTGRGWHPLNLNTIAQEAGFQSAIMPLQPAAVRLPYRFDFLFQRVN